MFYENKVRMMSGCKMTEDGMNDNVDVDAHAPSEEEVLSNYILKVRLKGDVFYRVYLAVDKKTQEQCIIKYCNRRVPERDPVIEKFLLQEGRILSQCDCSVIPRLIEVKESEQYIFIIREYIESVSLQDFIQETGGQPVEKVIRWGKQICEGLRCLHTMEPPFVHSDIRPSNIMLNTEGQIKLIDFGGIRKYTGDKALHTYTFGHAGYVAPELYAGNAKFDARTDVFALGMTMRYMLTGISYGDIGFDFPLEQIVTNIPKSLARIIDKCTQNEPADRYQNCDELLKILNKAGRRVSRFRKKKR